MTQTSVLIRIKENTYLGTTMGVEVTSTPLVNRGYLILGQDLINKGIDEDIDEDFEYFLDTEEVVVV